MIARVSIERFVLALLTLLAVSVVIFATTEALPGDIAARVLGRFASEEAKAAFRDRLNLDRPAYKRYLIWLSGAVQGDFGQSLINEREVTDIIGPRLMNTVRLGAFALVLYVPISVVLGTLSAIFRNRGIDHFISLITFLGLSAPEFILGTGLLILFSVVVPIFPVMSLINMADTPLERIRSLTLPAVTLAIVMSVYAIRMLRDNLIEVLDSEYIRMATLKGLPRYQILLRHSLPNALIPALNVTALNLAYLIGGVVIVEQVFAYPGLGTLLVESVFFRDVPVIEAVTLLVSAVYILTNLFADIMTILLNPRLRTG